MTPQPVVWLPGSIPKTRIECGLGRNQSKLKHRMNGGQYTTSRGCNPESFTHKVQIPPRQWVDASDHLYSEGITVNSLNPANGSSWLVQILSSTIPHKS